MPYAYLRKLFGELVLVVVDVISIHCGPLE
jgi:hypothetical protein